MGPPSVKYRGIFLNDEDFCLRPWVQNRMDQTLQDIGPNTYAHVFELMLRLKANIIWPAMHLGTKAFFYYEGNREMANKYQIVIGSSHCEPMLRNNVDEWNINFTNEYGHEPSEWRYDTNQAEIQTYWEDRVIQTETDGVEGAFTLGMRGIHDGSMPGPKTIEEKVKLMNQVFQDQRTMLSTYKSKPLSEIPQAFIPYAEVLSLYQAGAVPPEDVTIVWADDNHGYIRKLSNPTEQKRSGGSGVYYHLSYWMPGQDWLWLSSISPSLISCEMCKAYDYGADRMWIFNVGDLKPAEMEIQFAMDLGWDIQAWQPEHAADYAFTWAEQTFGKPAAAQIAEIKAEYYKLAASGKPEHMNFVPRTMKEFNERLAAYSKLVQQAEALQPQIPARLQDAYFQLILYPVKGAAKLNEKIIDLVKKDFQGAVDSYREITAMTETYNTGIAGGKWKGMMDDSPREQAVFDEPSALPGLRLDLTKSRIASPMVFSNGVLYGESPETCNEQNGGAAVLRFHSDVAATRRLNFYLHCPSPAEDSFFIRVNGKQVVANNISTGEHWRWKNIGKFDLVAGENTIEISQREPNAKIKIVQFGTTVEQIIPKPILVEKPEPVAVIPAEDFKLSNTHEIHLVRGLGIDGASLSRVDFRSAEWSPEDAELAPSASTQVNLQAGLYAVKIYCVPTFAIHEGRTLNVGVSLDNGAFQTVDMNTPYHTPLWLDNVFRGYSTQELVFDQKTSGPVDLKVAILDPGVALSRIEVVPTMDTIIGHGK